MSPRQKQSKFAHLIGLLICHIYDNGYEVTLGDAYRPDGKGHMKNSKHYSRLAIDLNLFKDGKYLTKTEDWTVFGEYFELLGGKWGGRFKNPDGNHFEL